jgi:folate-binding protein YgfZ
MVRVSGPDARQFLDGLLSQDLSELHPRLAVRSFLLSPQGKLRALLWVAGTDAEVHLYTDRGLGTRVATDLSHYKIRVKAQIAAPTPAIAFLDETPAASVQAPLGDRPRGFSIDDPGGEGLAEATWDGARIEAGEPIMDLDVDEKTIPQETGLVGEAVSFDKGCYLGQELVARLDSRQGRVNRNLRRVEIEGAAVPPAVASQANEVVGTITSIATVAKRTIGLGLLHRRIEPGDQIEVDGRRALVLGASL